MIYDFFKNVSYLELEFKWVAAAASHGLCQAQTAAAAVPEPQNRYFTRFSRSPPASSGCAQLRRHQSACGPSGDQGSQGEPPWSLARLSVCLCGRARAVLSRMHYYTLALASPTCPLHDISPIFRRCSVPWPSAEF